APKGDRCFELQLALATVLISSDPDKAIAIAKQARANVLDVSEDLENALTPLRVKAEAKLLTPVETRRLAAGEEQIRRYWLDLADASELLGDANLAAGNPFYRLTAQQYESAAAVREQHGRTESDRRARFRALAKQVQSLAESPGASE